MIQRTGHFALFQREAHQRVDDRAQVLAGGPLRCPMPGERIEAEHIEHGPYCAQCARTTASLLPEGQRAPRATSATGTALGPPGWTLTAVFECGGACA